MRAFRGWRRAAAGVAVGAVSLLVLSAAPGFAQGSDPGVQEDLAPLMLVLDASESMLEEADDGRTKMAVAKAALKKVIDELPADAEVGLTVYGSELGTGDKRASCDDIKTSFEVAPMDPEAMKATVDGIQGRGWTPIGGSLQHAAAELPDEGPRSILLISDGAETCAPPEACDAARQLAEDGAEVLMHTVGFDIDQKGRGELQCIAEVGGGEYVDAPDAKTLEDELPKITKRAVRSYEAEGIPVNGTAEPQDAPTVEPGQYVDRIDIDRTRYYAVEVPEGVGVHTTATLIRPTDEGQGGTSASYLEVGLVDGDGNDCVSAEREVDSDMNWSSHNTAGVSAVISEDGDCFAEDGRYYVVVERGGSGRAAGERDVEILVAFEPPIDGEWSGQATGEVPFERPSGSAREVVGGSSFNTATELSESGIYTDELAYGEAAFFRVPLDWGQGLSYQAKLGDPSSGEKGIANMRTELRNPMRQQDAMDWYDTGAYTGSADEFSPLGTPYVHYGNREEGGTMRLASVAGDYYIMVQVAPDAWGDGEGTIPVEIALNVAGEAAEPPPYAKVGDYPDGVIYDTTAGHSDRGDDAGAGDDRAGGQQAPAGDEPLMSTTAWWLTASGAAVLAGVGAVALRYRLRKPSGENEATAYEG